MGTVTNRTTFEHRVSVNNPDFADPPWAHNNASAQALVDAGVPRIYWKISGDTFSEMTAGEKATKDTEILDVARDATAAQLDTVEDVLRAFALTVLDELNAHADKINAILDAADNASNLAQFKTDMAAISDYPQRTVGQLKTTLRNKLGT